MAFRLSRRATVTWAPTDRIVATFLEVFPYAIVVDGIALGSEEPIGVDREVIARRVSDPFTINYYQRIGADLRPLVASLLAGQFRQQVPEVGRPAKYDLNSDLYPRDEYMVPPQP
jgi:spermidine synthase